MTATAPATLLTVPARLAATGWLNAFLAAGRDENRPILYRTLSVEIYPEGLHLIGCDGTALFRSWVGNEGAPWPEIDEAPLRAVVVMDVDGSGLAFMKTLLKATADEARLSEVLTLSIATVDDAATLPLGEEFISERLILRACGQRIDLRLFEDDYPDWRRLQLGIDARERMDRLMIATRMFGLVGKLKGVNAIDLSLHGDGKQIGFTASSEAGEVRGLMMPMRRPEDPAAAVVGHVAAHLDEAAAQVAAGVGPDTTITIEAGGRSATRRGTKQGRP